MWIRLTYFADESQDNSFLVNCFSSLFSELFKSPYCHIGLLHRNYIVLYDILRLDSFLPKIWQYLNGSCDLCFYIGYDLGNILSFVFLSTSIFRYQTICEITLSFSMYWKITFTTPQKPYIKSNSSVGHVEHPLHKKWSFPFRNCSVNVTKFEISCGSGPIYCGNLRLENFIFCAVIYIWEDFNVTWVYSGGSLVPESSFFLYFLKVTTWP